jgi:hypothetical protein
VRNKSASTSLGVTFLNIGGANEERLTGERNGGRRSSTLGDPWTKRHKPAGKFMVQKKAPAKQKVKGVWREEKGGRNLRLGEFCGFQGQYADSRKPPAGICAISQG